MTDSVITIAYWAFRGRSSLPVLLSYYLDLPFKLKIYTDKAVWFEQDKYGLGLDLPNLPYLIDGDVKLTESLAIIQYLVKKSGNTDLLGKDFHDQCKVTQVYTFMEDLTRLGRECCLCPKENVEKVVAEQIKNGIKPKCDQLNKLIDGKDYILGYLTIVDFFLGEFIPVYKAIYPDIVENSPELIKIADRVNSIEKIQEFKKSKYFMPGMLPVHSNFCAAIPEEIPKFMQKLNE